MKSSAYDVNHEFYIQRYKHGVRLMKPGQVVEDNKTISVIYKSPVALYFLDRESRVVSLNDASMKQSGVQSASEFVGKTVEYIHEKSFSSRILSHDKLIFRNESMGVMEEIGYRKDDTYIQALTIRFPWYYEDKVIGLMGFSPIIDPNSLHSFSRDMMQIISTGVLAEAEVLPDDTWASIQDHNAYFSQREKAILKLVVKGKTARQIGEILFLSKRTIEHYIDNIKSKAGCTSKYELIYKYADKL